LIGLRYALAVNSPNPAPLRLAPEDRIFLTTVAEKVLGSTDVAATTASALTKRGIDARRIDMLIPWQSAAVLIEGFVLKKVEPDRDTPHDFGLFVRRAPHLRPAAVPDLAHPH
jgi:hypothetical protein